MNLFSTYELGSIPLTHRIVMPPLTRMRSGADDGVPSPLAAKYYGQRSSRSGLIIAEATQVSRQGRGYPQTPGIHTPDQVAGWLPVTKAVKQRYGRIFLQLWHVGRLSHSSFQKDGTLPVGPSAVAAKGNAFTVNFERVPFEIPRPLDQREIDDIVDDYRHAAKNAALAGFDGVEIHAANGYLLQQFLEDSTNLRTDRYGGSFANRARLLLEVVDAVTGTWPLERVGVRLSPFSDVGNAADSDPDALYRYVVRALSERRIGYLHLIEPQVRAGLAEVKNSAAPQSVATLFRPLFDGPLIASGGFSLATAQRAISSGVADLVAFGRNFIANPDLPNRLALDAPLNVPDRATFYGGGERGYTDYPVLGQTHTKMQV